MRKLYVERDWNTHNHWVTDNDGFGIEFKEYNQAVRFIRLIEEREIDDV